MSSTLEGNLCLVTGGGGFIGSHLVEYLVTQGARTRAFVHYNALGSRGWLDRSSVGDEVEVFAGDITDRESLRAAMRGVQYVFHLAALIPIPYSYVAPESFIRTNVIGTLNALQEARVVGVERFIHTSTSEVYGTAQSPAISESHPLHAQSPYAATKIAADQMAEAMHCSFEVPVVTVRPFNTYGPRQSTRAVIPTIITQALSGKTIRLGSLHPTRDFNYVTDTVRGFALAATAAGAVGQTLNVGTGKEISIGDLAEIIRDLTGCEEEVSADEQRVRPEGSEVDRLLADNTRAREVLGWEPQFTIRQGLEATTDWMRDNLGHYCAGEYRI